MEKFRRAYQLRIKDELKQDSIFPSGDQPLAIEAGEGILRVINSLKGNAPSKAEKVEIERVTKAIKKIRSKPTIVTPILIPLGEKTQLKEILAPETIVNFDLAGDGRGAKWSWVSSDAGILVYDPQSTGKISSGRQLFGNATWWMFFRNGYDAMAALDDNGDAWLRGKEVSGLAIWRDGNENGVSDAGEVLPLRDWNIAALAVRANGRDKNVLLHARGCEMSDGTFRPTYDWVAQPKIEK